MGATRKSAGALQSLQHVVQALLHVVQALLHVVQALGSQYVGCARQAQGFAQGFVKHLNQRQPHTCTLNLNWQVPQPHPCLGCAAELPRHPDKGRHTAGHRKAPVGSSVRLAWRWRGAGGAGETGGAGQPALSNSSQRVLK